MRSDLVDRLWYQANRDPIAESGDGGHCDQAGQVRGRRVTDWARRYGLETLKPNNGGLAFAEGAPLLDKYDDDGEPNKAFWKVSVPLPMADQLGMTDVTRQVILSSPVVRKRLAKEIHHIDHAWCDPRLPEVVRLLLKCDEAAAVKLARCHDKDGYAILFHVHTADNGDETVAVKHHRERCWLRICPKCARDISARLRARYASRLAALQKARPRGWGFKHLILTTRRGDDGRDDRADLELLHKATKKTVHHFWNMRRDARPQQAGALAGLEWGPRGGNVHVHVIVWGASVDQIDIRLYWQKAIGAGDEWRDVHIEAITAEAAINEALKYATKFAKSGQADDLMSPADLASLHLAMRGKRRVWAWGALYGAVDDEEEAEEDVGRDAGRCDEDGERMLGARVAELRELLGLSCSIASKSESNCIARSPTPAAAMLHGGPGQACAPP